MFATTTGKYPITQGPSEMDIMMSLFDRNRINQKKVVVWTDEGAVEVAVKSLEHERNGTWQFAGVGYPKGDVPPSKVRGTLPFPPVKVTCFYNATERSGTAIVFPR